MLSRAQRKRLRKMVLVLMVLALIAFGGAMIWQWITYKKVQFVRYPEFGILIPASYSIHGIDVSRYQYDIDWEEVQKMQVQDIRLGFAFIKATEGQDNEDSRFRSNWKKAREAGVCRGAYHFFIASRDGRAQAMSFIKKVKLEKGDLPPVLDIEQLNGTAPGLLRQRARDWLLAVEKHFGVKPVIYTNVDFYQKYLGEEFDPYPLWIAHYYQPHKPRISRDWTFWQHNDEGNVNGIRSKVDFNVFNGDSAAFRELLIY